MAAGRRPPRRDRRRGGPRRPPRLPALDRRRPRHDACARSGAATAALLVFLGRTHAYEGHDPSVVAHGVRAAVRGRLRRRRAHQRRRRAARRHARSATPCSSATTSTSPGCSPLTGAEPAADAGWGPRFTDLTDAYCPRLRALARELDPTLTEGVYAAVPGPHYETPAEIRAYQILGADLVGMSTVHEVIAARHAGAEVLALSLVTNLAAGLARRRCSTTPTSSPPARPPPSGWATCSPASSPDARERRDADLARPGPGVARRRPRPGHPGRGRRPARRRRRRRPGRPVRPPARVRHRRAARRRSAPGPTA